MSNRVTKIAVSLLLAVTILCCSFSVSATDPTPTSTPLPDFTQDTSAELLWQQAGIEGIYLLLKSWGIEVTYNEVEGFTEEVRQALEDLVIEYLESLPSPMSIYSWVNPWLWSIDFWGNARFNSNMLEDVELFADWIRQKFNITDNSTIIVDPVKSASGYTLYEFDKYYNVYLPDGTPSTQYQAVQLDNVTGNPVGYMYARDASVQNVQSSWMFIYIDYVQESVTVNRIALDYNGNTVTLVGPSITNMRSWRASTYGFQSAFLYGSAVQDTSVSLPLIPAGNNPVFQSSSEMITFLDNLNVVTEGNVRIVTSTILLPSSDPEYTSGDSITIIEGDPDYSIIDWNGEVVVSNLPAVVSTGTVDNPDIIEFFRPISALIDMAKTPFEIMVQIIYRFPVEVNVCIMSLMGAICLFGIIKIMREH